MLLSERLRELREKQELPQRKLAAALDIDTATYCKFEKGILRPKREHITILSSLLCESEDELLKLWLADKITAVAETEKSVATDALKLVNESLNIDDNNAK